ncbi:hypothetical protein Pan258_11220 [Symmachiella dynata]|nr:hypothetical protein Pan258_11220 [Symmachiella dynata]
MVVQILKLRPYGDEMIMRVIEFLYRWFFAIMAFASLVLMALAAGGFTPQGSWKHSTTAYFLMALFFTLAFFAEKLVDQALRRSRATTPAEKAKLLLARTPEIVVWRTQRLSLDEAFQILRQRNDVLAQYPNANFRETATERDLEFRKWYESACTSDAELWYYDSGEESWALMGGECGFALFSRDELLDVWVPLVN